MGKKRKRRRLTGAQRHAIKHELMRKAFFRCQGCGTRHGTLVDLKDGTMFRYELRMHHMNGKPWDHRRDNLRVLCPVCRGEAPPPEGVVVLRPEEIHKSMGA